MLLGLTAGDVRLVQVTIPAGKRDAILQALDDEGIDYVVNDETSGREYTGVAYFPLPSAAVEPVLEQLRAVGIDEDGYTVIVDANTVISRQFDELQERYDEEEDEDRIAREELTARASDMAPAFSTYVVMTVVSALIATAGLLLDSPAVVVGSMVIAPLIGPAMATSVGTVMDDQEMFRRGVKLQLIGLVLAVVSAGLFAFLVRSVHLIPPLADVTSIPEIRERVAPDFLSLVVALGAGVAGVVSLSSGVSTALVGVMIAVALIPPAATVGIGMAWGQPLVSLGSAVLLAVNVLSINLAALVVLWYKGYQPSQWFRTDEAKSATASRIGVLVVAILVLSAFLGGVTLDTFERANTEEQIRAEAGGIVAEAGATLLEIEVQQTNTAVFQQPTRVVVTVGVPPGEAFPTLADDIDAVADRIADRDVTTEVRFVTVDQAG
nr:TIGR00341 family protein [Halomicrobium mukohataei]